MTKAPSISLATLKDYDCGENSGAHGNIYEKDLAFVLFMRGVMKNRKFKLANELIIAGKFDDVVMYFEETDETWLFQAKHAQLDSSNRNIIFEKELFPFDERLQGKDFDLFKYMQSFSQVESEIKGKKRYFIFTNKKLEASDNLKKWVQDVDKDEDVLTKFINFGDDSCKKFNLQAENIGGFMPMVNKQFYDIKNAIVKVFKSGDVEKILMDFMTPVAKMLTITNRKMVSDKAQATTSKEDREIKILRFSDDFLTKSDDPTSIGELYKVLRQDFNKELSLVEREENPAIKKLLDKGKSRNQDLPVFNNEEKVTAFFKSLILCVNQPNELRSIVGQEVYAWLRTWVRPDYLGKFEESHLKLPSMKMDEVFKSWYEPDMNDAAKSKKKPFLHSDEGTNCWDKISKELARFTTQQRDVYCTSYYVNRKVVFIENVNKNRQQSEISDNEFSCAIETKCIVLIAEPGMGKTNFLQYVSFEAQKLTRRTIFLIYLNSLNDKLLNETSKCQDRSWALDVIESALSITNNTMLQKVLIENEGKENKADDIWFFLDGFDEVPVSVNSKLILVVKKLIETKIVRVVISGRKHVESVLRNELAAEVIYLKPFKYNDQMSFLEKVWNIPLKDDSVRGKFERYAEHLLKRFHVNIYTYTKMPLMLRLLAEVYKEDLEKFLQSRNENGRLEELSTEIFTVISLFEQFVRKSFCMKMLKKKDLNAYSKNVSYDDELDPVFKQYILEHELEAINKYRHKSEIQRALTCHATDYDNFRKRIKDGKEKSLLININKLNIQFVHQSIEEYFVARYLYENFPDCGDYLCSIIDDKELTRKFFFLLFNENLEQSSKHLSLLTTVCGVQNMAFWACEALCLKVLKSLSSNNNLRNFFSEEYGSLLHVAAQNGSYEICLFLLKEVKINVDCSSCVGRMLNSDSPLQEQLRIQYQVTALHLAVANDHKAVVKLLLENYAKVDARNSFLYTPLHVAAKTGHCEIMELLIAHSADKNVQTESGNTPLHLAIEFNQVDCAKRLIDHGANVNIPNKNDSTPLFSAIMHGHSDVVKCLLDNSADVRYQDRAGYTALHMASRKRLDSVILLLSDNRVEVNAVNDFKKTALHQAAKNKDPQILKQLIGHSADPSLTDNGGWTPLHFAAYNGRVESVAFLVEQPIDINARNNEKQTPLHVAVKTGYLEILEILIGKSADLNAQDHKNMTPLHVAINFGHVGTWDMLITPENINTRDNQNLTPLLVAAQQGQQPKFVKMLIEKGSDVNAARKDGSTVMHWAAEKGHTEIARLLVEHSADVNCHGASQRTPLHLASANGHTTIVEFLIGKSTDVTAVDKDNNTPLHIAIEKGHTECGKLLIKAAKGTPLLLMGNKRKWTPLHLAAHHDNQEITQLLIDSSSTVVHAQDKDGHTPLHVAAKHGNLEVAELLLNASANVNALENHNWTPLHLAARCGHLKLVELLLRHSAELDARDRNGNSPLDLAASSSRTEVVRLLGGLSFSHVPSGVDELGL